MTSLVEIQSEVLAALPRLDQSQLQEVAVLLEISKKRVSKVEGKGWPGLLHLITSFLLGDEAEGRQDGGLELYSRVQGRLVEWSPEVKATQLEEDDDSLIKDNTPLREDPPATPKANVSTSAPRTHSATESLFRREFKIKGQIGEVGQRDRLTFSSLIHQIDRGLVRGYHDEEIVDAIISAMAPGLTLRSYLEAKPELNLPVLRRLLRSHYREKEATELYHDLTSAVQDQKESAQDFLLRMLALRQKILFASQEADATFKYDATLVQGMFLHSLLTGLTSDSVRNDLKPLLQDVRTSDEVLLERVNIAANNESERHLKRGTKQRAKVSEVSLPQPKPDKEKKTKVSDSPQEIPKVLDMKALQESIRSIVKAELAAVTTAQPATSPRQNQTRRPDWGCQACRAQGIGPACRHCFKCGSSEHYSRGCRSRAGQGNGGGAPVMDVGYPSTQQTPQ